MKIDDVNILNWEPLGNPPGSAWWDGVKERPDEPLIVASLKLTMTYREYMELCDKDQDARTAEVK